MAGENYVSKIHLNNDFLAFPLSKHVAAVQLIEAHAREFAEAKAAGNISLMREINDRVKVDRNDALMGEYLSSEAEILQQGQQASCVNVWRINEVAKKSLLHALEEAIKGVEIHFNECWRVYIAVDYADGDSKASGIRKFIDEEYIANARKIIDVLKKYHTELKAPTSTSEKKALTSMLQEGKGAIRCSS